MERGDEQPIGAQIQSIPQPRFVGSLLTGELPSLVGEFHSTNFMVEQPKNNVSDLRFEKVPTPSTFTYWKMNFKTEVCSGSGHPAEAMPWIQEVEMANSVDDLKTSRSISGRLYPNFETPNARIASALTKIIKKSNIKKKVQKQKAQKKNRFRRGRSTITSG